MVGGFLKRIKNYFVIETASMLDRWNKIMNSTHYHRLNPALPKEEYSSGLFSA